jgi:hypothetical protein
VSHSPTVLVLACLIGHNAWALDDKPTPPPSKLSVFVPEDDWRLAKLTDVQPQKIGILTYYPNKGGGYTFKEGEQIAFYALPFMPTTYKAEYTVKVLEVRNGTIVSRLLIQTRALARIGASKMPFDGQTLYRNELKEDRGGFQWEAIPIAKWSRDAPSDKFQLSIMAVDPQIRLKLKSIKPILENAPKPLGK